MRPISKSHYALLGLLTLGPGSGYDLNKLLELSLNHFWRESYGQIYPALKRLEQEGFIQGKKEAQTGKPDRTVYRITPRGEEVFRDWLTQPVSPRPPRNELLLKLFFGTQLSPNEAWQHLRHFEHRQQERLETYQGIERWLETEQAGNPNLPYWLLTLSYGRCQAEALKRWSEESLETLQKLTEVSS